MTIDYFQSDDTLNHNDVNCRKVICPHCGWYNNLWYRYSLGEAAYLAFKQEIEEGCPEYSPGPQLPRKTKC